MSEIITAKFDSPKQAFAAKTALRDMEKSFDLETQDLEVVTQSKSGTLRIFPNVNLPRAQMIGGAIWGGVLGAVFLMPLIGAAVGAAIGYVTGRSTDVGISRAYLNQIGREIAPDGAALSILTRKADPGALTQTLARHGGKVIRSTYQTSSGAHVTSDVKGGEKADLRQQPALA